MENERQPYPIKYYKNVKVKDIDRLWYPHIAYGTRKSA